MLNKTSLFVTLTALLLAISATTSAKKIIIKTIPANAEIFIDGQKVGEGTYTIKFEKGNDFYIVQAQAPNYLPKRIRVLKSNPQKTVNIRLDWDEALEASTGGEDEGAYAANSWKDITCRKDITEDLAWKRLMSIATKYFSTIDVRDKAAGWIKTNWKSTVFTHQTVRTRMEVRINFTDENTKSYRARIISEIKDNDCHRGNECFKNYDRVLKIYQPLLEELQTVVDGGE